MIYYKENIEVVQVVFETIKAVTNRCKTLRNKLVEKGK